MRILMLIDWNRGQGGAEAHALTLREGLMAAGDEVRLLTSSVGTAGDGCADYVAFGSERRAGQALLQIANPFSAATVRRAVREFRPDVAWVNMFAHHLSPSAVLALGDLPMVLLVSDYKLVCPIGSKLLPDGSICRSAAGVVCYRSGCVGLAHWLRDQPRYALIRTAAGRAKRILACSDWLRVELARAGITAQTSYVPSPPPPRSFRRRPAAQPTFLYFGRLDKEKGVDVLLRAFARLRAGVPTARLLIAGRGPERGPLEQLSGRLGVASAVSFLGWLSPEGLEAPLAEAWATVAPSLWAEPLGLVAIESAIRSVPAIVSDIGGLSEIITDRESGLLVPAGDDDALLDRLQQIASGQAFPDHRLPPNVVEATQRRFDPSAYIEELRQTFAEVAERTRETGIRQSTDPGTG